MTGKPTYEELEKRVKTLERDAAERRQMEEALKGSEESYRYLIEDAIDIIYKVDLKGHLSFVNPIAVKETGYTQAELIGKHYLELIHPAYREDAERLYASQFADRVSSTYRELPIVTKEGKEIWLGQHVQLMTQDDHVVGFHAAARDITKQKQAEDALRESNERLEAILHLMPVGVLIIDAKTHQIVDANPKAVLMIGAPLEQGTVCHKYICPAELGKCPITDLGQTVDDSDRTLLAADGEIVPVHKTVIPVTINGREFFIECFVDMREHKRTEDERIQKEKLQGIIEMAGAICHELNQPMQAILGFSELLMMKPLQREEPFGSVARIREQAERMGQITRKLMRITRYETKDYLTGSKIIDIERATKPT